MPFPSGATVAYDLSDLTDATGGGLTLTNNNAATFVSGKVGNAVNLTSASTQSLSNADNTAYHVGTGDFTGCCWANLTTLTGSDGVSNQILSRGRAGGGDAYVLFYDNTNHFFRWNPGSGTANASTFGAASTGTWYFIVFDFTVSTTTASITINNASTNSNAASGVDNTVGSAFKIGSVDSGAVGNCLVDEVFLWQRLLTAGERTYLWNAGAGVFYGQNVGGLFLPAPLTGIGSGGAFFTNPLG